MLAAALRTLTLTFLFGLLCGPALPASAAERILSFRSDTTVNEDSSLRVVETIKVEAEGNQIRRGIYRSFPTIYQDRQGQRVTVGFKVLSVRRDGAAESFHLKSAPNGVHVYMGSAATLVPPGIHTYTLTYRTSRQLGFFEEHNELYWNATGNDWRFPIEEAVAVIRLPSGAEVLEHKAYTGWTGEQGTAYEVQQPAPGEIVFRTTETLPPGSGLTIAVSWPKGHTQMPTLVQSASWYLEENPSVAVAGGGLLVVFAYYLIAWILVGRDLPRGVIIPRFKPPAGLSPAAVRFVNRRCEFDYKTLATALVNLAVKGYLRIRREDGLLSLERTDKARTRTSGVLPIVSKRQLPFVSERRLTNLSAGERRILKRLFVYGRDVTLSQNSHKSINKTARRLKRHLRGEYRKANVLSNLGLFALGLAMTVGIVLCAFVTSDFITSSAVSLTWIVLALLGLVNLLFFHILPAPTRAGRKLLEQIEGFKMYLTVAEKARLQAFHPPDRTPEVFERYLPYAMALDVEHEWAEQFADILRGPGAVVQPDHRFDWADVDYHHDQSSGYDSIGSDMTTLGHDMSSAIASASTPPGSTSGLSPGPRTWGGGLSGGSSGGGFSGGGGGGGGGGGW